MSFGNFLKNTATVVGNAVAEKAQELRELKEKYDALDDSELLSILESSGWGAKSSTEKNMAMQILKNRGHDEAFLRSVRKS
ncbi:MAG: hypothetical protein QX189_09220 [Methylococcales bacterium]